MTVGLIGLGNVGRRISTLFGIQPDAIVDPAYGLIGTALHRANVVFICVPTPLSADLTLDVTAVRDAVLRLFPHQIGAIKSTVNPGNLRELQALTKAQLVYAPEYYGMSPGHPNASSVSHLIFGGDVAASQRVLEVYWTVISANISVRFMSWEEAEVSKLSENRAIMFKVMQCQELYDACEKHGLNYYAIRDAVYGDDHRFERWFTAIYPDARGCDSPCIPKDVYAWATWADGALTRDILAFNEQAYRE